MKDTKESLKGLLYVGLDVHKTFWKVAIFVDGTRIKKEFTCDANVEALVASIRKDYDDYYDVVVAYEAGFCGFYIHDELNEYAGFSCIVVNPADIPTSDKERAQKEDKRDALKIAQQLKSGSLTGIYVPCKKSLGLRELVRTRYTLVNDQTKIKNRIKGYLNRYGIRIPKDKFANSGSHWSAKFISWLGSIQWSEYTYKWSFEALLQQLENQRKLIADITKKIRDEMRSEHQKKKYDRLLEQPGINLVFASTLIAEVIDINRFSSYDKFNSYLGLIPSTNSSGGKEVIRGVTKRSNHRLRTLFIQSAWVAKNFDQELAKEFKELTKRMKKNKAIIRIAKRIAMRVRYILLEVENQ